MMETAGPPKRRTGLLIWLIVSQLLALASCWIWVLGAAFSVMAFDSGNTREARNFVLAVWAYPLFPLVMAVGAWLAFALHKDWLAAVLSGLTFLPPAVFFLFLALGA